MTGFLEIATLAYMRMHTGVSWQFQLRWIYVAPIDLEKEQNRTILYDYDGTDAWQWLSKEVCEWFKSWHLKQFLGTDTSNWKYVSNDNDHHGHHWWSLVISRLSLVVLLIEKENYSNFRRSTVKILGALTAFIFISKNVHCIKFLHFTDYFIHKS